MGRLLIIAVRNLLQNKRRTLLLGLAIVAVTMLLVLMGALGNGIRSTMLTAGTAMITGHVNVGGFYKITSGDASPVLVGAAKLEADVRELVPDADHVVVRYRGFGKLVSESDTAMAGIAGIVASQERDLKEVLTVLSGSFEALAQKRTILLFEAQAERLGVKVGDEITISAPVMRGQNNSLDVTVGAIARDMGLVSLMASFASEDTIEELYQLDPDTTSVVLVYLQDPTAAEAVEATLRNGLEEKGYALMDRQEGAFYHKFEQVQGEAWTGMKLDLTTYEDELQGLQWTLKTFDTITAILIGILMVIVMVGVMNAMWITVRDRTREVGTLRAIGMGRLKVLWMFLLETLILSVVAAGLGVGLGAGTTWGLNALEIPVSRGFQIFLMSDTLKMVVAPDSLVMALVAIPLLTTVGAFMPAYRAARMRPVTAIHHVG
jgi:ABC-type lipoprotein release transport system permease subunit